MALEAAKKPSGRLMQPTPNSRSAKSPPMGKGKAAGLSRRRELESLIDDTSPAAKARAGRILFPFGRQYTMEHSTECGEKRADMPPFAILSGQFRSYITARCR